MTETIISKFNNNLNKLKKYGIVSKRDTSEAAKISVNIKNVTCEKWSGSSVWQIVSPLCRLANVKFSLSIAFTIHI